MEEIIYKHARAPIMLAKRASYDEVKRRQQVKVSVPPNTDPGRKRPILALRGGNILAAMRSEANRRAIQASKGTRRNKPRPPKKWPATEISMKSLPAWKEKLGEIAVQVREQNQPKPRVLPRGKPEAVKVKKNKKKVALRRNKKKRRNKSKHHDVYGWMCRLPGSAYSNQR